MTFGGLDATGIKSFKFRELDSYRTCAPSFLLFGRSGAAAAPFPTIVPIFSRAAIPRTRPFPGGFATAPPSATDMQPLTRLPHRPSSSHRLIVSTSQRLIVSTSHRLIVSTSHRLIASSSHRLIVSSPHRFIASSFHRLIASSPHRFIVLHRGRLMMREFYKN